MLYDWVPEKEEWLKINRGLSFHHVLYQIDNGHLLDVREHPNKEKYPHQKLLIVRMDEYVYVVPFVEDGEILFLKTIIPSRKETRRYWK